MLISRTPPTRGKLSVGKEQTMKNRNLDGMYFRVERDGKWQNVCFTDLTEKELYEVTKHWDTEAWINAAYHLRGVLRIIGEEFDLEGDI